MAGPDDAELVERRQELYGARQDWCGHAVGRDRTGRCVSIKRSVSWRSSESSVPGHVVGLLIQEVRRCKAVLDGKNTGSLPQTRSSFASEPLTFSRDSRLM